jgi:hypothetical protein
MGDVGAEDGSSEGGEGSGAAPQLPKCRGLRGVAERAAGLCQ